MFIRGFWIEFEENVEILVLIGFVDGILSFIFGKLSDYIDKFWLILQMMANI